jgi:hypothetical protein
MDTAEQLVPIDSGSDKLKVPLDAIIKALQNTECPTTKQLVVACMNFPVKNDEYRDLFIELFDEAKVDYSSLDDLPISYTNHSLAQMKTIAETHCPDLLMRAALKRKMRRAQRCILMQMECGLREYTILSIKHRLKRLLDFWAEVLANRANVEWGCNVFWIVQSIREIIFKKSWYPDDNGDTFPPKPEHLELGCNAIASILDGDQKARALRGFRELFERYADK